MRRFTKTQRLAQAVIETLEQRQLLSSVVGAHLFYNDSAFDQNDPAISAADDSAIATDKTPLRELVNASFASYSSYSNGINGVMVDIAGLGGRKPKLSDFTFHVGTSVDPSTWAVAPNPTALAIRPGAGVNGSARIEFTWANAAITKEWLQVTTLATTHTGLVAADTFYFGSAVGETGNQAGSTRVNAIDQVLVRNNPRTLLNPASITDPYDFNRDKKVDAGDQLIARDNQTNFLSDLKLLTPPPNAPGKADVQVLSGTVVRVNWRDNSNVETGYRVDEAIGGGAFTSAVTTAPNATAALVQGLNPSTQYTFRVSAINGSSLSSASVSTPAVATTADSGTQQYTVRLDLGGAITHGDAVYTASGTAALAQPNPNNPAVSEPVTAGSPELAVYKALQFTAHVNDTDADYDFSSSDAALRVESSDGGDGVRIWLEDSYGTTDIDSDYNDDYWNCKLTPSSIRRRLTAIRCQPSLTSAWTSMVFPCPIQALLARARMKATEYPTPPRSTPSI